MKPTPQIALSRWGLTALAAIAFIPVASAANLIVNMNIEPGTPPATSTTLVGPTGTPGETWNQSSAGSKSGLLDSTGAATTVGYSTINLGGPDSWGTPTLQVLTTGLRNFDTGAANTQQLVINGLTTGDLFNVWIASANTMTSQRHSGTWTTTNETSTAGGQVSSNISGIIGDTWVEGNNYVLFENVEVNLSGNLVFNGHSDSKAVVGFDPRLPMNGFQLVQVPEPSAALLGGLGLLALLRRRA